MELLKIVVVISITMALSITLTIRTIGQVVQEKPPFIDKDTDPSPATTTMHATEKNPIRLSRFLAEEYKNPRAADHCHRNPGICKLQGESYVCCNNKCIDVTTDKDNCGACKRKCEYTETCCRGECVTLSMDKRHCGQCNNRCPDGGVCLYGVCDYA